MDVFASNGILSHVVPRYEDRPEQRRMSKLVTETLQQQDRILIESPTGTGKTLAYLVPALLCGKRVVVSTGTKALQDQILTCDIPLLQQLLSIPVSIYALKGVSNYVCKRKLQIQSRGHSNHQGSLLASAEDEWNGLLSWATTTTCGDRAEYTQLGEDSPLWDQITLRADTRIGPKCPHYQGCFVTSARRKAEQAAVILVNHHLFFSDLSLRKSAPGARVLPAYDAVIFDESHLLEDVLTEHFGMRVSSVQLAHLARDLLAGTFQLSVNRNVAAAAGALQQAAHGFFAKIRHHLESELCDTNRVELPPQMFGNAAIESAWFSLDAALDSCFEAATTLAETCAATNKEREEEFRTLARRTDQVRNHLASIAEQNQLATTTPTHVQWGEITPQTLALRASPTEVGDIFLSALTGITTTAIFTSATLTVDKRFDYFRQRLGLHEDETREVMLESPFDYRKQCLLYIARDLPTPKEDAFDHASCQRVEELLQLTGGRAFILFTSHRAMRWAEKRFAKRIPYPLLVQGTRPQGQLINQFRARPSVLLGTNTFWQGVDVPGDALSLVVLMKLPFAAPTDPIIAARTRRLESLGQDPFQGYQLPQAALTLKQGFGRLIRNRQDRGIVAILDGRILTKQYGQVFLNTLPKRIQRTASMEQTRRWWQRGPSS